MIPNRVGIIRYPRLARGGHAREVAESRVTSHSSKDFYNGDLNLMNKIVLCVLALPFGLFAGMWAGSWLERAILGPGSGGHMNMSGIVGAFLGMPVGAAAFGLLGYGLGVICDRLSGSKLSPARVKRLVIAAAIGAGLGLPLSLSAQSSLAMIVGGWLGCLGGCLWNVIAKPPVDARSVAPHSSRDETTPTI